MIWNPFKAHAIEKNKAEVEMAANEFIENLEKNQSFMGGFSNSFTFPEGKSIKSLIQKSFGTGLVFNDSIFLNKARALESYFTSVIDYAAVFQIANSIAGLPTKLFRESKGGTMEEVIDHPQASPLLANPNFFSTWYDFVEGIATLTELAGFVPIEIVFPESPKELFLIRPDQTEALVGRQGLVGFRVNSGGQVLTFNTEEMFQIKYFNPLDFHRGFTAFTPMSKALSIEFFVKQFMESFFQNGGHIGGILKKNAIIQQKDKEALKKQFIEQYQGSSKAFKLMILGGGLEFEKTGVNPKEADLEAQDKYTRMQILSGRGVPPILIGFLDGASYANADVQIKLFFKSTVKPKATKIEQGLTRNVFSKFGLTLKFDFSEIAELQEDKLKNSQTAVQMRNAGVFTMNEIRQTTMGFEPLKGMDILPQPASPAQMAENRIDEMEKSLSNLLLKRQSLLGTAGDSTGGLNGFGTGQPFGSQESLHAILNGSGARS